MYTRHTGYIVVNHSHSLYHIVLDEPAFHSMSEAEEKGAQRQHKRRHATCTPRRRRRHRRAVAEVALAEAHVHLLAVVLDVGAALFAVGGRSRQTIPLGGESVVGVLVPGFRRRRVGISKFHALTKICLAF